MERVKLWTENIIIVVIISIIIEMILPEGNSKKYVKVVSGIYLLYVIINPILNLNLSELSNNVTKNIIGNETIETASQTESIVETYVSSLESSIEVQIEELGYSVQSVKIILNSDYSDVENVIIKLETANYDESKIKQVVLSNFDIDSNKIKFS